MELFNIFYTLLQFKIVILKCKKSKPKLIKRESVSRLTQGDDYGRVTYDTFENK